MDEQAGTLLAAHPDGDIYEATDKYSRQNKIEYIYFRNIIGNSLIVRVFLILEPLVIFRHV